MDFRHSFTKEVRTVNGSSSEGKKLAKDPHWDKCPESVITKPDLPSGVVDHPTVPEVVNPEITPE